VGLFLDLFQQSQIRQQSARSSDLEQRVRSLEQELDQTRRLLRDLIQRLETHVGKDLNADGKVG
jgi:hypothetical protein